MKRPLAGPTLDLDLLDARAAIARLAPDAPVPGWATGPLTSITRTASELSVVCSDHAIPDGVRAERGWRILSVRGPLAFTLTGVLAALVNPLAVAEVPVLALSTFDTDYLLVRDAALAAAIEALRAAGHRVHAGHTAIPSS